jgi:mannose-6-phosphate isomerase-like protein (cupin superfamily)
MAAIWIAHDARPAQCIPGPARIQSSAGYSHDEAAPQRAQSQEQTMSGYSINIEQKTLAGNNFREVLYTTQRSQLVIMTLQPGEEIGLEKHEGHDQFIRVEAGQGVAILDGEKHALEDGVAVVIPAGTEHNVINTSTSEPMRLYTLYTPPEHPDGIVHRNKAEADEYERQHGH